MHVGEVLVGVLEFTFLFTALLIFWIESERWPLRYLKWTPFVEGTYDRYTETSQVTIGVRRKDNRLVLVGLIPTDANFDSALAEAVSEARARCIELNASQRSVVRRLPR